MNADSICVHAESFKRDFVELREQLGLLFRASMKCKLIVGILKGRSATSEVKVWRYLPTKQLVAIKRIERSQIKRPDHVLAEKHALQALNGLAFVPKLYATHKDDKYLYFISELIPSGNLAAHVKASWPFPASTIRFYAAELVLALDTLHRLGIIHRDIKPGNIVLRENGHLCIVDFGLSKLFKLHDEFRCNSFCGTLECMAPEVVDRSNASYLGKAVDWWSLGVTLYYLTLGKMPFEADCDLKLAENILKAPVAFPNEYGLDSHLVDLLSGLLTKDPSHRLANAQKIKSHTYFSGVGWPTILTSQAPPYNDKLGCTNFEDENDDEAPLEPMEQALFDEF